MRTEWRTHQDERDRKQFICCQDAECPADHFISSFKGSRETVHKWEGVKH